jgi:hypothetical protein
MGTIILEGEPPFELATQKSPIAIVEGKTIVLTLPVFADGVPHSTADIRLRMSLEHAEQLGARMLPVLVAARANRKIKR